MSRGKVDMTMMLTMLAIHLAFFHAMGTEALSSALFRRTANISAANFSVLLLSAFKVLQ
jgi:hypothetical protein